MITAGMGNKAQLVKLLMGSTVEQIILTSVEFLAVGETGQPACY